MRTVRVPALEIGDPEDGGEGSPLGGAAAEGGCRTTGWSWSAAFGRRGGARGVPRLARGAAVAARGDAQPRRVAGGPSWSLQVTSHKLQATSHASQVALVTSYE